MCNAVWQTIFGDIFFFSSRRRHTRLQGDWSSDVCSSDLRALELIGREKHGGGEGVGATHALPLVGQIAAGGPLLAEQNIDAYISVPEPLSRGGEEFLLRVRGD